MSRTFVFEVTAFTYGFGIDAPEIEHGGQLDCSGRQDGRDGSGRRAAPRSACALREASERGQEVPNGIASGVRIEAQSHVE